MSAREPDHQRTKRERTSMVSSVYSISATGPTNYGISDTRPEETTKIKKRRDPKKPGKGSK